jgi:hypothetical protein
VCFLIKLSRSLMQIASVYQSIKPALSPCIALTSYHDSLSSAANSGCWQICICLPKQSTSWNNVKAHSWCRQEPQRHRPS